MPYAEDFAHFGQKEQFKNKMKLKACVRYFLSKFYFSLNDNPSKTMEDVFYFI